MKSGCQKYSRVGTLNGLRENAGHENAGQVQHNTQAVHAEIRI